MNYFLPRIALVLLLVSCSGMNNLEEFEFYDSSGKVYALSSAPKQLMQEYGLLKKPKIVLVLTKSAKSPLLKKQLKLVHSVDAERFGYIVILANTEKPDTHGYHAGTKVAEKVLSSGEFHVIIFDEISTIIASSTTPLSPKELKKYLADKVRS